MEGRFTILQEEDIMSLSINTNVAALNAYRNLNSTQNDLGKSLERLSSGLRINRAADDAAGLAISEGLRSQINGTKQAVLNAQNGISVVQTAEGALTETHSILQRMRTLSVQAANDGGLSSSAKTNIQDEMGQLKTELTRISDTTQFNGAKLLDGSYRGVFQVGANTSSQDQIVVDLTRTAGMSSEGLGIAGIDVTAAAKGASSATTVNAVGGASAAAGTVTVEAKSVAADGTVATAGADDFEKLNGTISMGTKSLDLASVKYADSTANAATKLVELQAALDKTFGSGALTASGDATALVVTGATPGSTDSAATVASKSPVFTQASGATEGINLLDKAIADVSSVRSQLGAVQNRFDHTINNLNVASENLSASESRIRDTDMANEMVSFTRAQILSQAGTAMLAQAKNLPQSVLQLLQ